MAIGDQSDINNRIESNLPPWFGMDITPILNGIIAAFSWAGSFSYGESVYIQKQTRITSATDSNLDLIAQDFFGNTFPRNSGESDASYRNRILQNIILERATRIAMQNEVLFLTGNEPFVFEPQRTADTGSYGTRGSYVNYGAYYSRAGRYGSILTKLQGFVTAFISPQGNIANLAGYNISTGAYSTPSCAAYSNILTISPTTLAQIYTGVNNVKVAGTLVWVRVENIL